MSEKYPYIAAIEISKETGERGNDVSSVTMKVRTSYYSDEMHEMRFKYDGHEVKIKRHTKDYPSTLPDDMVKRTKDVERARALAWEQLERLNLDDEQRWFEGCI